MVEADASDSRFFKGALVVSLLLHGLVALLLIGKISGHVSEPLQDVVDVQLVAPAEEAPEQAEAPPPPPAPEAEEEPPEGEQEPPPPSAPETAETPSEVPVLQPVEQFGDEDTAPRETAEETPPEPAEPPEPETAAPDEPTDSSEIAGTEDATPDEALEDATAEPDQTDVPQESETAETETPETDTPDTEAPETEETEETAETTDPVTGTEAETDVGIAEDPSNEDFGTVGPIVTEARPAPKPARRQQAARPQQAPPESAAVPPGMLAARELYSRVILDDPQARSAMRGMSEGQRLNLLCMTELRAQIASVSALPPELLPSFRPRGGTVLQPRNAAFRSLGRWFNVTFRCETDAGVTRVEKFAFKIGSEIPQSQWLERGLTGF